MSGWHSSAAALLLAEDETPAPARLVACIPTPGPSFCDAVEACAAAMFHGLTVRAFGFSVTLHGVLDESAVLLAGEDDVMAFDLAWLFVTLVGEQETICAIKNSKNGGRMIQIDTNTTAFPMDRATWQGDLPSATGPLAAEFRDPDGTPVVYVWCDFDERAHRWIAFRVAEADISALKRGKIDIYELVPRAKDGAVYVVDMDDERRRVGCAALTPKTLPPDYPPRTGSCMPQRAVAV